MCSYSYKNNTLKISHSKSEEFSSYLPLRFVHFLKSRLIFNIIYCFLMFVNKLFMYLTCANLQHIIFIWKRRYWQIFRSALAYLWWSFLDFKPSYASFMIQKRSCTLSTKVNWNFYDTKKIRPIMINNVNIFTIYESLL